ncbi:hypothetical protein T01_1898 [Trichinella spiralis]|uniref:Uncharacterized protein n=1 Tax=Trichinella spiralis TaxID=6334 RepID=A0A0V1AY45_TRISP|nr:hypothetical protein T01_1898 [Trichinella spiralis]
MNDSVITGFPIIAIYEKSRQNPLTDDVLKGICFGFSKTGSFPPWFMLSKWIAFERMLLVFVDSFLT